MSIDWLDTRMPGPVPFPFTLGHEWMTRLRSGHDGVLHRRGEWNRLDTLQDGVASIPQMVDGKLE